MWLYNKKNENQNGKTQGHLMSKPKPKLMQVGQEYGKALGQNGHVGFGLDELDA